MSSLTAWLVIAGMAAANFAERFIPIAVVSRMRLPDPVQRWLSYVPVAVMAALVSVAVLRPNGAWLLSPANPYLLAALPTGAIYYKTRSFLGTTIAGIAIFLLLKATLA